MKYEVIKHLTLDGIAYEIGSEIELAEEIADAIPGALRAIPEIIDAKSKKAAKAADKD